jgi:hypothetical protein
MKPLISFAMVILGAAAGCGGGSSPPASGAPVSLGQLPAAWAQTVCAQNFKCASAADIMMRKQADCLQSDTTLWQGLASSIQTGQGKGRVTYDAAQMGLCLQALAQESCAEWVTGLTHDVGCPEAFTAKVSIGGACLNDGECIMGFCNGADNAKMPPVEGACKARIAHGAACTSTDTCVATDYCDGTANTCMAKKTGGADCLLDEECGNSCNPDTSKCSGYAGCSVAPISARSTLLSVLGLGLVLVAARRWRRSPKR